MTRHLFIYLIIGLFILILVSGTFSVQTTSNQVNPDWILDGYWTEVDTPSTITIDGYLNANFNSILTRVDLAWETTTEINNDFFTIEKSKDGKAWKKVSTVDGAGNGNQLVEYFDVDYKPFKGVSYYRLKQTNFDGEFSYSNTVSVNFITTDDKAMVSLFPSPVLKSQALNIEINNTIQLETLVVLRDARGQEFYLKTIINEDRNGILSTPINSGIPPGIYVVIATSNKQFYSKKLVIQ